jgi:hypothetical protein
MVFSCSRGRLAVIAILLVAAAVNELSGADPVATGMKNGLRIIPIGPGYALNHINATSFNRYNLLSVGEWQFAAYYNDKQKATIARRRLGQATWQLFPTSFTANNIKDVHDIISIAVDGNGFLHMSWGMHNDVFHYARTVTPVTGDAPIVFGPDGEMTGQENDLCYPEFFHLPHGDLLYMFREGGSGNGDTYLSRYDLAAGMWKPVHAVDGNHSPFIKGRGWTPNSSAYPNNLIMDSQRRLHLIWTWRYNNDSPAGQKGYQTNHNLSYACSADFGRTWSRSDGKACALPMHEPYPDGDPAGVAEVAVEIPEGSSLINTTSLAADRDDRPVIASYWAPEARAGDHRRQYMLAWHDGRQWRTSRISRRGTEYDTDGDGRSDPIPEARLGDYRMARPMVVVDRNNRVIVVFNDCQQGQQVTAAWSDDRVNWRLMPLTTERIGAWEPTCDTELWRKENRLHMLYQPVGLGAESSTVAVLEWDSRSISR